MAEQNAYDMFDFAILDCPITFHVKSTETQRPARSVGNAPQVAREPDMRKKLPT